MRDTTSGRKSERIKARRGNCSPGADNTAQVNWGWSGSKTKASDESLAALPWGLAAIRVT